MPPPILGAPPGVPGASPAATLKPGADGYTVTGDANLIHSRWALRYTIDDPEAYGFRFNNPAAVIQSELDHAVAETCARFTVDQALRTEIEAFRGAVDARVRRRCEQLGLGIKVERVDILALVPPRQVAEAFAAVIAAENERSQTISAARADAARALNEAQGEAAKIVADGEAYQREIVSRVSANAFYFTKVYEQYAKNPGIISRTLLQDTLRRTLANVQQKQIVAPSATGQQELRLLISPEPPPLPTPRH